MIDQIELGNLQGCVYKIAQHPTFICNCNSRFVLLKKYQLFFWWTESLCLHFNEDKIGTKWNKFAWENQKFTHLGWSSMFIQCSSETGNSNWWSRKELMQWNRKYSTFVSLTNKINFYYLCFRFRLLKFISEVTEYWMSLRLYEQLNSNANLISIVIKIYVHQVFTLLSVFC